MYKENDCLKCPAFFKGKCFYEKCIFKQSEIERRNKMERKSFDELSILNNRKKDIILDAIMAMIYFKNEVGKNFLAFDIKEMHCNNNLANSIVEEINKLGYKAKRNNGDSQKDGSWDRIDINWYEE